MPTQEITEAELLLAQARERGSIPLPQLTDTDLCVFTDSFATLLDKPTWDRWWSMPEQERDALATRAMDFLAFRRLLRPIGQGPDGRPEYRIQPKLGYILTARQSPSVLGVCSVPGYLRIGDLRLFLVRDETGADPFVVLERTTSRVMDSFGRIRQYVLATVDAAGGVTADWMVRSAANDLEAAGLPRLVELYWHPEGQPIGGERVTSQPVPGGFTVTHTRGDTLVTVDQPMDRRALAVYVAGLLRAGGA